ncbi:MAG: DNA repair protein RadC [Opitutales bacterium]
MQGDKNLKVRDKEKLKTQEKEKLNLGHRQRIRQRFIDFGYDILLDYERLELFLTLCIPRKDVKAIAKNLLIRFGSISGVINAADKDLAEINGVGESVICNIKILRMCVNSHIFESIKDGRLNLDSVDLIARYFESRIANLSYEVLEVICLDSQLKLLGSSAIRICEGSVNFINVNMRKIIEIAFENSASSIVLAHNHPQGEAKPSPEDVNFTKSLSAICRPLKLDFIEHIIIAKGKYFSFRNNNYINILYDSSINPDKNAKVSELKKTLKS